MKLYEITHCKFYIFIFLGILIVATAELTIRTQLFSDIFALPLMLYIFVQLIIFIFSAIQTKKIAYAGPISSITGQVFASFFVYLHYSRFPFTLILCAILELINLIPFHVDDGTFSDGFWIKYPRIRMYYTNQQLKEIKNIQKFLKEESY